MSHWWLDSAPYDSEFDTLTLSHRSMKLRLIFQNQSTFPMSSVHPQVETKQSKFKEKFFVSWVLCFDGYNGLKMNWKCISRYKQGRYSMVRNTFLSYFQTFTTVETITNAKSARSWLLDSAKSVSVISVWSFPSYTTMEYNACKLLYFSFLIILHFPTSFLLC